ncbi:polysaccharide biosynthesis/export family protein [Sulfurovum sp. NBC37-1]|uniref:polysaccharide biosynthesis/export family protein n=1 Tax=Sulfurovum sp. (strain NBC37-1) TaxID=387093 RepID=UPI0001587BAB|nr:polysaccharide biosynthesis/export family protein [Sulfurovum sp. NBC37-1]BAF72507.1 polysaccharide export system outer membrane protein [Sulfurovum sp. NBC37-1]
MGRNDTLKILVLIGFVFTLVGCSNDYELLKTDKSVSQLKSVKVSARSIEYRILPQDRLEVILYKDPSQLSESRTGLAGDSMNSKGVLVNAAGYITMPLIGKVKVSGLTQTQAAEKITRMYKKYLNTPSVYLEVLNKRILVLGEVNSPGVVEIDKEKMTLFEALAHAGDLSNSAVRNEIIIVSSDKNGMWMRMVDLTNFDKMNYASLMLRPNDIVYVKPNNWKQFKVASGDVTSVLDPILKIAGAYAAFAYIVD